MIIAALARFHVGAVESCSPTEIKVLLDGDAPQDIALNTGRPQGFPRLNGYVLIPNEQGAVVAVISRMTMEPAPAAGASPEQRLHQAPPRRRLYVTPLGTLEARLAEGITAYRLKRGVASYPSVGDAVILASADQLRSIVEATGNDRRVRIGTSRLALDAAVTVDPDKLFGRHLGVFGNTGSGKSCTVAGLLRWSVEASGVGGQSAARFIVLDPNGEYRTCFNDLRDRIDVKVFSAEPGEDELPITLPGWLWNGEEWAGALDASPGTQRPVLMQAIRHLRAAYVGGEGRAEPANPVPSQKLVLSGKVRAFIDYLVAQQSQGQGHLTHFPVFRALHSSLRGLPELLQRHLDDLGPGEADLTVAMDAAIAICERVRERRTNGERINHFEDGDLEEIAEALRELQRRLPAPNQLSGPSEDMPTPFEVGRLPEMISTLGELQGGGVHQHLTGLDLRLRTMLADPRIAPIIADPGQQPDLTQWLHNLIGSGDNGRGQITVIDLSLVPSDVRTTIVGVLARLTFEAAQRYRRQHGELVPTVLVLEEAHNFLQRQSPDQTDTASAVRCRHTFEKIAKEGRKFGVGLVVSSQRPAELSPTTVAQCNSFILHRIVNDRDQDLVSKLAPDTSGSLLKELPSLPTQQAIVMGLASEIPLVFDVRLLPKPQRPNSDNPEFWHIWSGTRALAHDFTETVASWTGARPVNG